MVEKFSGLIVCFFASFISPAFLLSVSPVLPGDHTFFDPFRDVEMPAPLFNWASESRFVTQLAFVATSLIDSITHTTT